MKVLVIQALKSKMVRDLLISAVLLSLSELSKRTDNTVDDQLVEKIKQSLGRAE